MLERLSRSTLPYGIDDPTKSRGSRSNQLDLGELCIDLYNGQKTINLRSGARKPFSIPIVATNFGADEMDRWVPIDYSCRHALLLLIVVIIVNACSVMHSWLYNSYLHYIYMQSAIQSTPDPI